MRDKGKDHGGAGAADDDAAGDAAAAAGDAAAADGGAAHGAGGDAPGDAPAPSGEKNPAHQAREAIITLSQKTSVADYAAAFTTLAIELPNTTESDQAWLSFFFERGLKPTLRTMIAGKYPETVGWEKIHEVAHSHELLATSVINAQASGSAVPMDLAAVAISPATGQRRAPTPGRERRDKADKSNVRRL